MSKKVSEFDRYERMKKMEKEAEIEKRKTEGLSKKKSGKSKMAVGMMPYNGYKSVEGEEDYED